MSPLKLFSVVTLIICNVAFATPQKDTQQLIKKSHAEKLKISISQNDIEKFATVLAQIQYFYIKPVSYQSLFNNAIKGMLTELDPHSSYLTSKDLETLTTRTKGEFAGIGVSILPENNLLRVISPIDDSPAHKAGILSDDVIFKVNNSLISEIGIKAALDKIKGEPGTTVSLSIYRPGTKKIKNYTLTREKIKLTTVRSKIINHNLGYIRISNFADKTSTEILEELKKLTIKAKQLDGLIIDLRNNPGGLLYAAIRSSDLFLDASKLKNPIIVSTKGRIKEFNVVSKAQKGDVFFNHPIVILINHGSASASEIMAAALGDHNRAIIIGTRSFGKGSVQTVLPTSNDTAIKLTTALYYTPNGTTIQAQGVQPDIIVKQLKLKSLEGDKDLSDIISEATLSGHLKSKDAIQYSEKQSLNSKELDLLAEKDFQLYEASKILETLILSKQTH